MNTTYVEWAMKLFIPGELHEKFFNAVCMGQIYWQIYTEYINVLLCAQSKSGSIHTNLLLSHALGFTSYPIGYNDKGGLIYYPRVLAGKFMAENTVSRCHSPNNVEVTQLIETLDLRPVVMTRSLLDSLVSKRDHVMKSSLGDDIKNMESYRKFHRGDNEYQLDLIIEKYCSEFIDFFTSWEGYNHELIWITYEEMVSDSVGMVKRVADALGCEVVRDVEEITAEIEQSGRANFNKGVSGRGAELFNDRQKEEIGRKADILGCKDEDFLKGL